MACSKVSAYNERQAVEFTFSKHDAVDAQGGSSIESYWLCDRKMALLSSLAVESCSQNTHRRES